MFIALMLFQIVLAVLAYGMDFAHSKQEFKLIYKDNRACHARAMPMALSCLVPLFGAMGFVAALIMTDFARHGIKFK